jgi:hypothetical protein
MLGSISYLFGLFSAIKDNIVAIQWVVIILLLVGVFLGVRSCEKGKQEIAQYEQATRSRISSIENSYQQEIILIKTRANRKAVLKDSSIAAIMDSLNIKDRQISELKKLKFGKVITKTITEYDTLYEFIELNPTIPNKFTKELDNCLTVSGEFTPNGLVLRGDRNIEIHDISYFKRRNLFGLKFFPRIGKKEFYQTLVTNCGDTVTENKKIIFEK